MPKTRIPITRVNKFFSEKEFELELAYSREYLEGDLNFTIILYRVDLDLSSTDDLYGEARNGEIRYKTPVEVNVVLLLNKAKNSVYNKDSGSLRYLQDGSLEFGVFDQHLDELDVKISFGDYIGYPVSETEVRYFTVVDDGSKNYDNSSTILGYKSAFRTVTCAPVDYDDKNLTF